VGEAYQAEVNFTNIKAQEPRIHKLMQKRNDKSVYRVNMWGKFVLEDGKWSNRVLAFVGSSLIHM
jgi:hypothetical protein